MQKLAVIVILSMLSSFSCEEKDEIRLSPIEIKLSPEQIELIDGSNRFGLDLFREILSEEDVDNNIFISPLSVHLALSMTWNGAGENTRKQIMETLNYPDVDEETVNSSIQKLIKDLLSVDRKIETGIANSIWYRDDFTVEQDFLNINREYFDAQVNPLDFNDPSSSDIINEWVAEKTNNRIDSVIDQINPLDIMFLINAIYFKGVWTKEFDIEKTQRRSFFLSGGDTKEVMTMETEDEFAYAEMDGYKVAELPYGQGNYSMLVFLPDNNIGADGVIRKLDSEAWNELPGLLDNRRTVNLRMPKFTFDYDKSLNDALISLGMEDAFDESSADFSRINSSHDLFVSKVRHKSFIEVNEEGTEAAAVTAVTITTTSYDPDQPRVILFHVNRPFVIAIKEKYTNSIIFIGKVMEP